MTDLKPEIGSQKTTGSPQVMLRGLLMVLALAMLVVGGVFGFLYVSGRNQADGPQQVGMLDQEAIYALPEFTQAKKDLEQLSKAKEAELKKAIDEKKVNSAAEAENLRLQMRQQLEQEQARRLKPLNDRVTAAIAMLANERHLRVVLEKRIVISGVTDVTEDVKKKFAENKSPTLPKEASETQSHVGYINQEVVAELKLYKQVNEKLQARYQEMGKQFQAQAPKLSPDGRERLQAAMAKSFKEMQAELLMPVNERVNGAISEVAKEKGLSLVLNSSHIMWGGRNLTDDVVKKLVDQPKS